MSRRDPDLPLPGAVTHFADGFTVEPSFDDFPLCHMHGLVWTTCSWDEVTCRRCLDRKERWPIGRERWFARRAKAEADG